MTAAVTAKVEKKGAATGSNHYRELSLGCRLTTSVDSVIKGDDTQRNS